MADWSAGSITALVKTAYNLYADNALRPELYFVNCAKVEPSRLAMPGSVHAFTFYPELPAITTALSDEVSDPTFVTVTPDNSKTVTLVEYGNAARSTRKFRGTAYVPAVDRDIAELIGWNAGLSQDTLARTTLVGGSNVAYGGTATSTTTIAAASTLTGAKDRYVTAKLRGNNAKGFGDMGAGDGYVGFIHPDVSVDLRAETGAGGWAEAANNSSPAVERRWNGVIGKYEGIYWIETPRCPISTDASNGSGTTGTVDVYSTIVVGKEAIAFSHSADIGKTPEFVMGPTIDALRRNHIFGWYWLGGFCRYREEALYRIETSSSIGSN